jgi:hypothetical protein
MVHINVKKLSLRQIMCFYLSGHGKLYVIKNQKQTSGWIIALASLLKNLVTCFSLE